MRASLDKLFSVSCPDLASYSKLYNDYEDGRPSWIPWQDGRIIPVSEPFCGRQVLTNPWRLFLARSLKSTWIKFAKTSNKWVSMELHCKHLTDQYFRLPIFLQHRKLTFFLCECKDCIRCAQWQLLCVDFAILKIVALSLKTTVFTRVPNQFFKSISVC